MLLYFAIVVWLLKTGIEWVSASQPYLQVDTCRPKDSCLGLKLNLETNPWDHSYLKIVSWCLAKHNVTQESQLVVVHHELNAVNLQRLCVLLQTNKQEVGQVRLKADCALDWIRTELTQSGTVRCFWSGPLGFSSATMFPCTLPFKSLVSLRNVLIF